MAVLDQQRDSGPDCTHLGRVRQAEPVRFGVGSGEMHDRVDTGMGRDERRFDDESVAAQSFDDAAVGTGLPAASAMMAAASATCWSLRKNRRTMSTCVARPPPMLL